MSGTIHGLQWFKNIPDKFVTWGSDINLYQVKNADGPDPTATLQISPKLSAIYLASETRYEYIRCLSTSFHRQVVLVAAGTGNGRVGICNFEKSTDSCLDFTPRQQRTCLCLAWAEFDPNLLAIGHDRNRSDHCITIWDTERGLPKDSSHLFGLAETANSLCWDNNSKVLIAGMSQKNIKLFDIRYNNISCSNVSTRLVHGLTITANGRYLASYLDTVVALWDLRSLEKPLSQISIPKNISKIAWCPQRTSVLSVVQRDSSHIYLIQYHCIDESNCDIFSTKRMIAPFNETVNNVNRHLNIADATWHPQELDRVLVLSESGMRITDFCVPQQVAINLSSQNNLACTIGLKVIEMVSAKAPQLPAADSEILLEKDIRDLMEERALNDYGLLNDVRKNGDLSQNSNLKLVWSSLANTVRDERMLGLRAVLGVSSASDGPPMSRSDPQTVQWPEYINNSNALLIYKSEQREYAQSLCGWTFASDPDTILNKFLNELCGKKEFSRAAMIAVFYLKIKKAIEILQKAADQTNDSSALRIAVIALSGFNADRCCSVWRSQRMSPASQISDASLRTIFAFLTNESDNFEAVLMEKDVPLGDRMAFACRYLSDTKLADFVKEMIQSSTERGDLCGLILTSETNDAISMLQSYLDRSGDVQTVALIAIRLFHVEIFPDYRIQFWVSSYRNLLDSWGLWEKRAEVDMKIQQIGSPQKLSRSVFLLCHFCGKSVSSALQDDMRIRNNASNFNKLSSCPHCRKPLPRCSLCLLHMGTTTYAALQSTPNHESLGWQSKPFSKWFSWCQTCRHGGHTEHLIDWFKRNAECPITACSCKCFSLDMCLPQFLEDDSP